MDSPISARGSRIAAQSPTFFDVLQDLWDPLENPNGIVNMGLAENNLMQAEVIEYLNSKAWADPHTLTYGDGFSGSNKLKKSLAYFLNRHFGPHRSVTQEHIIVTAGVGNAIECCAWSLCDPGDYILVARPYWTTFRSMLGVRAGVNILEVDLESDDPFGVDALERYKMVYDGAIRDGKRVRGLLFCNPHNPLGQCYSSELVKLYMTFCQERQIHFISDEIYALSVWEEPSVAHHTPFTSALSIDMTDLIDPALVHVLWGMSKDFGATGLRIGCIISQDNPLFVKACTSTGLLTYPSSLADKAVAAMLADDDFMDNYVSAYRRRLKAHYEYVTSLLKSEGIPCQPSNATLFVWANLRAVVKSKDVTDNQILSELKKQKLYITSGEGYRNEQSGWFRIVFAHPKNTLDEGLRRLLYTLSKL